MLLLMYRRLQHQPRPKQGLAGKATATAFKAKAKNSKGKTKAKAGIWWPQVKTKTKAVGLRHRLRRGGFRHVQHVRPNRGPHKTGASTKGQ